ncbi:MAG TPA: hypothetical protein VF509_00350 [Sphingobium sp.]
MTLLTLMAQAAAERATRACQGSLMLQSCSDIAFQSAPATRQIDFEAWPVRGDDAFVTIAAFAMTRDANGVQRIAAHGRFTFTTIA